MQHLWSQMKQQAQHLLVELRAWTWRRWLSIGVGFLAIPVVGGGLLYAIVAFGWLGPLPDRSALAGIQNYQASEIYAADGSLLGKYFLENRSEVAYADLPPHLLQALVATEDARFYEHGGVDLRAMARVAVKSILLQDASAGGGSTLSQQLAKNLYPRQSYALLSLPINKIREMIVAKRLEDIYSKEEILTMYLNTVPFGENVFGIGAASQRFFQKAPQDLLAEEAATLIGMLKATTAYNPRLNPERSRTRRNVVLGQMLAYGFLPAEVVDSLRAQPLTLHYRNQTTEAGTAAYFRQHAALEIKQWLADHPGPNGDSWNLYTDGLKIYTTIDPTLQAYAEAAVQKHMAALQETFDAHWQGRSIFEEDDPTLLRAMRQSDRYTRLRAAGRSDKEALATFDEPQTMPIWTWEGEQTREMTPRDSVRHYLRFLQAGLLAVEPTTGYIRAWVGGINHRQFKYDHVTAQRQVGSTFKPIIYSAALVNHLDPCEYYPNEQVVYEEYDNWSPGNADGRYEGYYSLSGGLTNSVNTVSAAVMMKVGVDNAWNFARRFGFQSDLPKAPSLVLGTADLSLLEMVGAYTTFANQGLRSLPVYVTKIEDSQGRTIIEWPVQPEQHRVMEATYCDMMTQMLQAVVNQGTGSRLRRVYGLDLDLGGKTGTTQDQTDGWFIGVNPKLVIGAWVGGEARKVRFRSLRLGQGANTALPIVGLTLQQVEQDRRYHDIRQATLPSPGSSAQASMDCPPYQERVGLGEELDELMFILKQRRAERVLRQNQGSNRSIFEQNRARREDIWDKILPGRR